MKGLSIEISSGVPTRKQNGHLKAIMGKGKAIRAMAKRKGGGAGGGTVTIWSHATALGEKNRFKNVLHWMDY